MNINPTNREGIFSWILTGFIAGTFALLIGYFLPTLVPKRAAATKV